MRRAVSPEHAGVQQRAGVPPVRLHLPRPGRVHGGEVWIRDDDLMAEPLQTAGDPFTVGRGLEQDARPGPLAEHGGDALRLGADPLLDELTPLSQHANLTFLLVDVDANMVHGWPLLSAALTACNCCGAVYATTSSERPAAFITSRLLDLGRHQARVHEDSVYRNHPGQRIRREQRPPAERRFHLADAQNVADQLRLVGEGALRHSGQRAQVVACQVWPLRSVEEEVHAAHGVDRRSSPDAKVAARERRGALARQFGDQLADKLGVLSVEMLAAERVGELEHLLDVTPERLGDSKRVVVAHLGEKSAP